MAQFKWRKWNNILHRDIGYLVVALTLIYGISGLAVNHVADWNPNYKIEKEMLKVTSIEAKDKDGMVSEALAKLQLTDEPTNTFRPDPETLQLFFDKKTYSIDVPTGNVLVEQTRPRRVLYEMNQLHLNAPKGIWTFIADLFALSLIMMAITGMFMLKGPTGITGRGKWLISIGVLIPALFWIYWLNFN
jgi:hypothetical protein